MTDEMETTWREARQPGNDVICLSCGGRMFSSPKEYWNGDEGRQDYPSVTWTEGWMLPPGVGTGG